MSRRKWHGCRHGSTPIPSVSLGTHLSDVGAAVADLQQRDAVGRIWKRDHTVWKPDPKEISDLMREQLPALKAFAEEVREAGFRHTVLLGMGGSSLGSEVLRQSFGVADGYPDLMVLDSTVPAWILSGRIPLACFV